MKRLIFILLVLLSFIDVKAQFPSTDSLRNYNIVWITNNAARAFTNYRLHTLLAGMIDWIDTARTGGGGSIGIDSIAALNDSTLRYRINGTFRTFTYKGVYDARRKVDTLYKTNDSTIAFIVNGSVRSFSFPGRINFVDSIYRKTGQDSIFYRRNGVEYALKDSTGGAGSTNTNVGSGFRWAVVHTNQIKTAVAGYGVLIDSTSTANSLRFRADTTGTNGLVTRTELLDSTDITTQVESPIYVKLRATWPVPDTLAIDTTVAATRARLYKVADSLIVLMASSGVANTNLGAGFRWLVPSSQGIKTAENTSTVTWDSVGTNTLRATVPDNAITDAKLRQSAARSVIGRSANSTGNVADITSSTANRALTDNGTSLGWRQIDLTNTVTGALPEDNLAAFRTYPAESNNEIVLLDQSAWTAGDLGAQFSRGANHTISLNGSFPRIASSTIVWGGASLTRFLPNLPIIAIYDKIEVDYQIVSALASNVGFGPSMFSNNVNGANFGYTTYLAVSTSTATPHFAKQDGTSDQTAATFTVSQGDVIRQTIEFLDTVAIATFQNLTTSSVVRTITKSFVAGTAPYPPNTGTWGFQNFSGTYEIRRVKITTRKTMSPTLMVAFDSKGQIVASPWDRRFSNLLNARYPSVLNYSGGGDQLKDLIDKKIEFSRINPEQVLIGLGSNDLRYGSSLVTTLDRLARVVRMVSGSTTRWAITVVPEDSTAGGTGLTALKNNIASAYPNNYIDLWTISSTSNVLKAAYNSGDGVHPNTEWHRIADSVIAASGFFSVQSPNRRSPYQKFGGGIWATGDSLYGPFKTPLSINSMLRFNDSNQVTHSIAFGTDSRFIISPNYPHVQAVSASVSFHMDGLQAYTGGNGGNLFYDRTNTSNFHTIYSNNNVFRFGYNGTDNFYYDNNGYMSIGTINSGLTFTPTFWIKKNRTMSAGSVDSRGISSVDDSITVTMPGGTHSNVYKTKIADAQFSAGSAEVITRPVALFVERPRTGANVTFTNPFAIYGTGRIGTDSTFNAANMDSTTSATGGFVYKDFATGNFKLTGAPSGGSGITSINGETGAAQTIAGGNGLTVNTTTNTATVVLGGTLSGTTQILGASNALHLGTAGSKLSTFNVNSSGNAAITSDARLFLMGNITYQAALHNTDATHTVASNTQILELNTSALTTDRNITLPTASTHGQTLTIVVRFASSGNHYTLASAIEDVKTGATFTQLDWGTTYELMVNSSLVWMVIRRY